MEENKVKVAIFQPHIGSGGLTHVMLALAEGLIKRGYEVDLVILDIKINSEVIHKIPSKANLIRISARRTVTAVPALLKYLKDSRPAVMISGGPSSNCIALIAKLITKQSTKFIITEHSLPSVDVYDSEKKTDKFIPLLMKLLYPRSDHIVAVSNAVASDLCKFSKLRPESIKTIYNPVVENNLIESSKQKLDHPWFQDERNFVVLFVGRLESVKNLETLVRSFSYLKDHENIKLVVVGDGSQKNDLKTLSKTLGLSDRVSFVGYSSNPYAYMRSSNLLILCSKWEGLPTVLIEAMACGTPVIATENLASAKEIFEDGKQGFIVESNPEAIAEGIKRAMKHSFDATSLTDRAALFSLENSLNKYEQLFH